MPSNLNTILRTISSMARGMVVEPYRTNPNRTRVEKSPQNGMVVHFDIRLSYYCGGDIDRKRHSQAIAFQILFAPYHHVFLLDNNEERWWLSVKKKADIAQYRCISAHDSCWANGYESYINQEINNMVLNMSSLIGCNYHDITVNAMTSFTPCKVQYVLDHTRRRDTRPFHYSPLRINHLSYGY